MHSRLCVFKMLLVACAVIMNVGLMIEPCKASDANLNTLRFGTLPVVHALPLYVAGEKGIFKNYGLQVELLAFNSGMEKDVALSAKEISGYFGDMLTPIVLCANQMPVQMVATTFNTTGSQRMFAILAAPNKTADSLADLAADGVAVSSNTVIDYVTSHLLAHRGIKHGAYQKIETKKIPIRLQMLLSNQVPAATLPEPLVTLAEIKGARVLADDAGKGITPTVFAFRADFLKKHADLIKSFLKAVQDAAAFIAAYPQEARFIMNRFCRVPALLQKNFAIPAFPKLAVPDRQQVINTYTWLKERGIIKSDLTYSQMVADEFIP